MALSDKAVPERWTAQEVAAVGDLTLKVVLKNHLHRSAFFRRSMAGSEALCSFRPGCGSGDDLQVQSESSFRPSSRNSPVGDTCR